MTLQDAQERVDHINFEFSHCYADAISFDGSMVCLDGKFSIEDLEAVLMILKNKGGV